MTEPRAVLISGTSSGIGRATALRLDAAGYRVFAGVLKDGEGDSLRSEASERLEPVQLDVTDAEQIAAAVARVEQSTDGGRSLAAVVGNAGTLVVGPTAHLPLDQVRAVFEVNLFGHLGLVQACMPMLRRGRGRIIGVSSVVANTPIDYFAAYCASKAGTTFMLHALRRELRAFGIPVVIIEPGIIRTAIWEAGHDSAASSLASMDPEVQATFEVPLAQVRSVCRTLESRGTPPESVARIVKKAIESRRPRIRYLVGRRAHLARVAPWTPMWIQDLYSRAIFRFWPKS